MLRSRSLVHFRPRAGGFGRPLFLLALGLVGLAPGCSTAPGPPPPERIAPPSEGAILPADSIPMAWMERPGVSAPRPSAPEAPGAWADSILSALTLRQKVGQMIMPFLLGDFAPEGTAAHARMLQWVEAQEVGGVIVSVGTPLDVAAKLNTLQRRSRVPLLVAADLETGAGFRLRGAVYLPGGQELGGATQFPSLMALGATGDGGLAYEMGRITALEARAVGIHVPFAPVLDVNSNPDNPVINTRSLGEDPAEVSRLGVCLLRGIQDHGGVATGKHFPGHGETEIDSHLALPILRLDRDRLETVEFPPFRAAVDAGVAALMTAHIALPSLTEEPELPATLSRNVLTGLLRETWGFEGLIFTDAMDMNAIDRRYSREEASVRAVLAGADILLMPPDPEAAIRGILEAVLSGRIPEDRIDASVRRILRQKEALGLPRAATVDLEAVQRTVGIPAHVEVARTVAERSLTLLRNERNLLPLRGTRSARVLSITYRRPNDLLAGRTFDARLRQTYPSLQIAQVQADTPARDLDALLERARAAPLVVVSLHVTAISYAGTVALPEPMVRFLRQLADSGVPHVVVSFGNPYLLSDFPDVQAYLVAWNGAAVSQRAAAGALFGEIPIRGRTPTRIPPSFPIGAGIQLPENTHAFRPSCVENVPDARE
jgi:beta-N-acetylhexosaminidase